MEEKIKSFFRINNIYVDIIQVINSIQLNTYFLKVADITPAILNKINKIQNALALYLQVENINISIDYIKGCIILEIPQNERKVLTYKELIKDYKKENGDGLYCNIGINTENQIKNINLCDLPHLLIAGTTGSGKSVLVNTIIMQLLENYTPKQLELILIDIKKVEFSIYEDIPHLLYKPITTLEDTRKILQNTIDDMSKRYETLKNNNCRNIIEYDAKNKNNKMKYKLIIIDELAELLLLEKNKLQANLEGYDRIEKYICRIAQLGRASGIHLIVATQRPSSDVISGLIKSNIPSKIALTVSNSTNSRIILDEKGAERLTGKGDYLLKIIGTNKVERLQSAYIDENELLKRLTEVKDKYNYNNIIDNINKRNILQILEKELDNYFKNAPLKYIASEVLQQVENINIIIDEIAENDDEKTILYNNYIDTFKKVERYYKGYKTKEKRELKELKEREKEKAKVKRRDKLLFMYLINKMIK